MTYNEFKMEMKNKIKWGQEKKEVAASKYKQEKREGWMSNEKGSKLWTNGH